MTQADFEEASRKALNLFEYGQVVNFLGPATNLFLALAFVLFDFSICLTLKQMALEHGLILVDTKYEFGKADDGSILLIDEVNSILEAHQVLNVFNTNNINNVMKFLYLHL